MDQSILFICIGGAVTAGAFFVSKAAMGGGQDIRLRQRLHEDLTRKATVEKSDEPHVDNAFKAGLKKIGTAAAEPFMPSTREKQSAIRRDLYHAGIYAPTAVKLVTGAKFICLIGGLLIGYTLGYMFNQVLIGISVGGLVGYLLPKMWLKMKINGNQKALTLGLPDALDLMVVCVEAGLTVDAAMQRVGQELVLAHPAVSRELGIAHMETRVGLSRAESLKNLGLRTGNSPFQSLAAMLIQAERFGTSIAGALRIHADSLRINRQHAAEEMAAKASVKMSFPLVLFIFPATFIVLAGPTILGLMHSALFNE